MEHGLPHFLTSQSIYVSFFKFHFNSRVYETQFFIIYSFSLCKIVGCVVTKYNRDSFFKSLSPSLMKYDSLTGLCQYRTSVV